MDILLLIGGVFVAASAGSIAILVRAIFRRRISLARGLAIVTASCVAWNLLCWLGLRCTVPVLHSIFFLSSIVPFAYGFGGGTKAAVVVITVQSVLAAVFGSAVYWWLRKETREHPSGG